MKTLGWLAMSRSFGAARRPSAPLRWDEKALPRFGPTRPSPFATASGAAERVPGELAVERTGPGRQAEPKAGLGGGGPFSAPDGEAMKVRRSRKGGRGRWWPFRNWARRGPRRLGPLVQGELSLDAVQVVRNDLSDADVELVTPARAVVGRMRREAGRPRDPLLAVSRWRRWLGAWVRMAR